MFVLLVIIICSAQLLPCFWELVLYDAILCGWILCKTTPRLARKRTTHVGILREKRQGGAEAETKNKPNVFHDEYNYLPFLQFLFNPFSSSFVLSFAGSPSHRSILLRHSLHTPLGRYAIANNLPTLCVCVCICNVQGFIFTIGKSLLHTWFHKLNISFHSPFYSVLHWS